jgi:hypothetical protein
MEHLYAITKVPTVLGSPVQLCSWARPCMENRETIVRRSKVKAELLAMGLSKIFLRSLRVRKEHKKENVSFVTPVKII